MNQNLLEIDARHEGEIGAGRLLPFPTTEELTTKVFLPETIARSGPIGTLTVRGDSLNGLGIYDGDKLICKQAFSRKEIKADTVCVVYLCSTGEVLAKRVRFQEGHLVLRGFNRDTPDIYAS